MSVLIFATVTTIGALAVLASYLVLTARWNWKLLRDFLYFAFMAFPPIWYCGWYFTILLDDMTPLLGKKLWAASLVGMFALGVIVLRVLAAQRSRADPEVPLAVKWRPAVLRRILPLAVISWLVTVGILYLIAGISLERARERAEALIAEALPDPLEDAENAAPLYERAVAIIETDREQPDLAGALLQVGSKVTMLRDRAASEERRLNPEDFSDEELESFFLRHEGSLALIREAYGFRGCQFEPPAVQSIFSGEISMHPSKIMDQCGNVLFIHGSWALRRDEPTLALLDGQSLFRMGRQWLETNVSSSLDLIASSRCTHMGMNLFEKILAHPGLSRTDLDGLDPARFFPRELLGPLTTRRVIDLDEAEGLLYFVDFERALKRRTGENVGGMLLAALYRAVVIQSDLSAYRMLMSLYRSQVESGRGTISRISEETIQSYLFPYAPLSGLLTPPFIWRDIMDRTKARFYLIHTASAALRYFFQEERFPERLELLVPDYLQDIPEDPFDHRPIRLKLAAGAWSVYSIGPDRVDDGGIEPDESKFVSRGDMVVTLPVAPGGK